MSLVEAQLQTGYRIIVVCNHSITDLCDANLRIVALGGVAIKPRWLETILFGRRCQRWLHHNRLNLDRCIVHSHERTWCHDVTTFHGQVYGFKRPKRATDGLVLRHKINLWLENKLVAGVGCRGVVPVSSMTRNQLLQRYNASADAILQVIEPGVNLKFSDTEKSNAEKSSVATKRTPPVVGFIGKEWKRKGLQFAFEIIEQFSFKFGAIELRIVGTGVGEVENLIPASIRKQVHIVGWLEDISAAYNQIDVLLHPATVEPYGMVIAEAMAQKVPVLVSDACGICGEVSLARGRVLSVDSNAKDWAASLKAIIVQGYLGDAYQRPWSKVADEYHRVYEKLHKKLNAI